MHGKQHRSPDRFCYFDGLRLEPGSIGSDTLYWMTYAQHYTCYGHLDLLQYCIMYTILCLVELHSNELEATLSVIVYLERTQRTTHSVGCFN